MADEMSTVLKYINSLLQDANIPAAIPERLKDIDGVQTIDNALRNLRHSIRIIGDGDLAEKLSSTGYLMGTIKSLQATLRNLIWQTKAISAGNFSNRVEFLGEFSSAFNGMVKKLESTISEVNEAKSLFELFFETIPDATLIIAYEDFKIFNCNHAFEKLMGSAKASLIGKSLSELKFFTDNSQAEFESSVKYFEKPESISLKLSLLGYPTYYGLFSSAIININDEKYILSVIKNITELKNLEDQLRKSEEIHRLLADNANDVIWIMDLTGKFTYISPSVEKLRGFTVEEVMTQSKEELLCPDSLALMEDGLKRAIFSIENNLPFEVFRGDIEQPCKDGTTIWTDLTVSAIFDKEEQFLGMLGVTRDITERKAMEDEIRRITELDHLTQLYNRLKIDKTIKQEIARSGRSHKPFAIILFDIDNFKRVNDTFGHNVGDEVLQDVGEILRTSIRKIDTAGRWGGEEFMLVLPESDANAAVVLAEKIRIKLREHTFAEVGQLTASFGIAAFTGELSAVELVARADGAMYQAKNSGKDQVATYLAAAKQPG